MSGKKSSSAASTSGKAAPAKGAAKKEASKKAQTGGSKLPIVLLVAFVAVIAGLLHQGIITLDHSHGHDHNHEHTARTEEAEMPEEHRKWLEYISPKFDFVVGEIGRIQVTPDEDFTQRVVDGGMPVIIENSATTEWEAFKRWNPAYMVNNVPEFKGVQVHQNKTFYYFHNRPMENLPLIRDRYKSTTFKRINMSSIDFISKLLRPPPYNDFFYMSGNTDLLGDVMHDLYPVEPLILKGPEFKIDESYKHRWTHVWIGPSGATSHLHYDIYENFYAQLYGWKRFVLIPPEDIDKVYIYPALHPGGQSSQVNVENPNYEKFPKFRQVRAFDAIIGPGEVLYVPPLWLHHVIALDVSMSVSVWSRAKDTRAMWEVEKMAIPVKRTWTDEKKLLGARYYLEAVIDEIFGAGSTKAFVEDLLDQRYVRLMKEVPSLNPQDQSYCVDNLPVEEEEDQVDFKQTFLKESKPIRDQVVKAFKSLSSDAVRKTWLGNFCENIAFAATDAAHVGPFLQDLVQC